MTTPTMLTELRTVRRPVAWWGVWVVVAIGLNAAGLLLAFHDYVPAPERLYLQAKEEPVKARGEDVDASDGRGGPRYLLDATPGDPVGPVTVEYIVAYPDAEPVPLSHTFDQRPADGYQLPVPLPPGGLTPDEPTMCRVRLRSVAGAVLGPGPRPRREGTLVLPPVPLVQFAQDKIRVPAAATFPGADLYVRGTLREAPRYAVVSSAEPARGGPAALVGGAWRVPADALTGLPSADRYTIRLTAPRGAALGRNKELEVTLTTPPLPVRVAGWAADPAALPADAREGRFKLALTRPAAAAAELKLTFVGPGAGRLLNPPDKLTLAAGDSDKVLAVALAGPAAGEESAQTVTAVLTVPAALGGPDSRSTVLTLNPAPIPVRVARWAADPATLPASAREAKFYLTLTRPAAAAAELKLTFAGTGRGRLENPPDKLTVAAGDKEKVVVVPLAAPNAGEESAQTVTATLAVPADLGGPDSRNADLTLSPAPPPPTLKLAVRVLGEAVVNPATPDASAKFDLTLSAPAPADIKVAVQFNPDGKDTGEFRKHLTGAQEVVIKKGEKAALFEVRAVAPAGGRLQPNRLATVRFGPPAGVTAESPAAFTQTIRVTERLEDRPFLILVVPPVDPSAAGEPLAKVLNDWAGQKDAGRERWVRQAVVVRKDGQPLAMPVAGPADLVAVPKADGVGPLAVAGNSRSVQMVNDVMAARRDLLKDLDPANRDRVVTVVVWPSASSPAELDGTDAAIPLTAEAEADLKALAPARPGAPGRLALMWYSVRGNANNLGIQTAPLARVAAYLPNQQVRLVRPATTGTDINNYLAGRTLPQP